MKNECYSVKILAKQKEGAVMLENLIDRLDENGILTRNEYKTLIENRNACADYLFEKARQARDRVYGRNIYIRGLIEFTNYCKNDCFYCGIRKSNKSAERYRLSKTEILHCCRVGYALGFRTFVLQGGEDMFYTDEYLCEIISEIKNAYSDCAVTLSLGERSYESYKALKTAGADRYLLRHETADRQHYSRLHPENMCFESRIECLENLKMLGYQVGAGFMVGTPFQTAENLAGELLFLKKINPQMVGIGPFIPHRDTPFKAEPAGTAELTVFMLALVRLTLKNALIPATTALGTIDESGREKGINAGANVLMPNLSPVGVRKKYALYDNKICMGDESAHAIEELKKRIKTTGCEIEIGRGDCKENKQNV